MRRKLVPWILACVGLGLVAGAVLAGETPRPGTRPFLGLSVEEETEGSQGGARVTEVIPDSPAEKIGLREGDVIVRVDGKSIYGPQGLTRQIREHEPGQSTKLEVVRDGVTRSVTVVLGERRGIARVYGYSGDDEPEGDGLRHLHMDAPRAWVGLGGMHRPRLGVQLVETTPELREHLGGHAEAGVLVGKVMKGMPAEMAGIRVGDIIESVDGQTIEDTGDLIEAIQRNEGGVLRLEIVRGGRPQTIEVTLPEPTERDEPGGPRA